MNDSVEYRNWLVSQGSEFGFEYLELWMNYRSLASREEEEFQDMAYWGRCCEGQVLIRKEKCLLVFENVVIDDHRAEVTNFLCHGPDSKYFRL